MRISSKQNPAGFPDHGLWPPEGRVFQLIFRLGGVLATPLNASFCPQGLGNPLLDQWLPALWRGLG